MRRPYTRIWLNLLLVIAMVIGPWPVLADSTDTVSDCCITAMEIAEDTRHAGCGSQPDQEQCCMDQGCVGSNCSVTLYISPDVPAGFEARTNAFPITIGNAQPSGASAPPTPPPIA